MSEVVRNNSYLEIVSKKNIKIDSTNFTQKEINEIETPFSEKKEVLYNSIKNELNNFIENDYWSIVEKLIWKNWIIKAWIYFWIESWNGVFSIELQKKVIEFQIKNLLNVDWIIWPDTLRLMENKEFSNVIPWANNINEIFEKISTNILNKYIWKLNSKEWINLSKEQIYNDILSILNKINLDIDKNNIFRWEINLFKENFFEPKDKWIKLITYLLEKKFPWNSINTNLKNNLDDEFSIFESSIMFLYDSGNNKSIEEVKKIINEFKNISEVKLILERIPNLNIVFWEMLPWLIQNISRDDFNNSLKTLYSDIKFDLININNYLNNQKVNWLKKSKLNIINKFTDFLKTNIDEESVDIINKWLLKMDIIKNNSFLNDLLIIVNWSEIDSKDRYEILNYVLDIIKLSTSNTEILEWTLDIIGSEKLLPIFVILANKNPEDFKKIVWKIILNNSESWWKLDINYFNIADLAIENFWILKDFWLNLLKNNIDTKEDLVLEIFKNKNLLDKVLKSTWWKLTEVIRNIINIDLKKIVNDVKNEYIKWNINTINDDNLSTLNNLEWSLFTKFGSKIEKGLYSLLKETINSNVSNNLTKDMLVTLWLNNLKLFLSENSDIIINYINKLWIKTDTKDDIKNIENIIKSILENPWIKDIIWDIISDLWNNVKGDDVALKIKNIIDTTINSKGNNLLNKKNKLEITNIAIDTLFDIILSNSSNLESVVKLLKNNIWIGNDLNNDDIKKILLILKKYIWKDKVKDLFLQYPELQSFNLFNDKYSEIILYLYNWIYNKTLFIDELLKTWVISSLKKSNDLWINKQINYIKIKDEDFSTWIDFLYTTLDSLEDDNMWNSLNNILKEFWFEELANVLVLWNRLWNNIVSILNSVDKKEFKIFILNNNENINNLINWNLTDKEKLTLYTKIWTDLLKIIDIDIFKSQYVTENLSWWEKIILDLSDEFQKIIIEKSDLMNSLIKKRKYIFDIYWWSIDIDSAKSEKIKEYWREVFDLLNSLVLRIDENYLSNIKIWWWDWKNSKIVETFIDSFEWENKWFITKEWFSWIFSWFDFDTWNSIDSYFRDSESNRDNFWDTLYDFLTNK